MKKFKTILWIVLALILGLFIYQNSGYFFQSYSLIFNLPFTEKAYVLPRLPNGIMFLICFLIGFFTAYFLSLMGRIRYKKEIKKLSETIKSNEETISDLEKKLKESVSKASESEENKSKENNAQNDELG